MLRSFYGLAYGNFLWAGLCCVVDFLQLPQRTVSELVRYYYMWKSTYRHEMFATRMRMLRLQKQLEQQQAALYVSLFARK